MRKSLARISFLWRGILWSGIVNERKLQPYQRQIQRLLRSSDSKMMRWERGPSLKLLSSTATSMHSRRPTMVLNITLYTVIFLTALMLQIALGRTLLSLTTMQIALTFFGAYVIGLVLLWVILSRSPRI